MLDGGTHHPRWRLGIPHISGKDEGLGAESSKLIGELLELRRSSDVHRGHSRWDTLCVARQPQAGGPPDSARRSRNQYVHVNLEPDRVRAAELPAPRSCGATGSDAITARPKGAKAEGSR